MCKTVIFIGAGNLATHLAAEMSAAGFRTMQVYSRTADAARTLAGKLGCGYTTDIRDVLPTADLYVFALKDDVLPDLVRLMKPNGGLWVHTSGSSDMNLFESCNARYGVFYPLQTFSKEKPVNFAKIPVFIEANTATDVRLLETTARMLTRQVICANSQQRRAIHLSAVFAGNFTNHMYAIAAHLLQEQQIPFQVLLPLIRETAAKIETISPDKAQTGPAIRYDKNIIGKHLHLLDQEPELQSIYESVSQDIHRFGQKNNSHE